MSLAELKNAVNELSVKEAAELESYVRERLGKSPDGLHARWSSTMRAMDEGKTVPLEKVKALHEAMEAVGM